MPRFPAPLDKKFHREFLKAASYPRPPQLLASLSYNGVSDNDNAKL